MPVSKIIISLWLFLASLLFTSPALAQTSTSSALPSTISPTSPLYTDLLVHNIFHTFSCLAVGQSVIGQPCLNYVQGVPVLSSINSSGGTLGAVTGLIAGLYQNPPVRTSEYLGSLGEQLGIVKQVHAQGVVGSGAGVLQPIQTLWQVSRNISYVIMIVIFVVIGIMIIFRQKINPQTVITAQAALPGLVIGLILITFSYFLSGLISDMAFVGTNIVGAYFSAVKSQPPQNLVQEISEENILGIFSKFIGIVTTGDITKIASVIFDSLNGQAQRDVRLLVGFLNAQFFSPITGAAKGLPPPWSFIVEPVANLLIAGVGAALPAQILGLALGFVASMALLYQMIKLLIRLLNSYLTIIFMTISAPFTFLFSSLPGRQGLATDWIMNLLANVLVFPAVIAVLYFVAFILGENFGPLHGKVSSLNQINHSTLITSVYAQETNSIVGSNTLPLFGGLGSGFIRILLAFGALMAMPAIPDIVVKTVGKVGQAGQLIGQEVQGGIRGGQGYLNQGRAGAQGLVGGLKTNVLGESGLQYTQGGISYGTIRPGMRQAVKQYGWNPFKWK